MGERDRKSELIEIISRASNHSGNLLLDFMDRYGYTNLKDASVENLERYVASTGLPKRRCADGIRKAV